MKPASISDYRERAPAAALPVRPHRWRFLCRDDARRAWALAGAGQDGVADMPALIGAEMRVAMGLTGAMRIMQNDEKILAGRE